MLDMSTTDGLASTTLLSGALGSGLLTPRLHDPPPTRPHEQVACSCSYFHSTPNNISFSPQTCIELLPQLTKKQLDYEFKYFKTHVKGFDTGSKTRVNDFVKSKSLSAAFVEGLSADVDKYVENLENYQNLITYFSYSLNGVIDWIEGSRTQTPEVLKSTDPKISQQLSGDALQLQEPVGFLDFEIKGDVGEFIKNFDFKNIGERKVCYFGNVPYKYGNTVHDPQPYPDSGALHNITAQLATKLDDPNFNIENYSCLITLYEDGESCLPYHSDNEFSIVPGSDIYTISLGGKRDLNFRNTSGLLQPRSYNLADGSVHRMSYDSQFFWEHSIPKTSTEEPRISLTFRHLAPHTDSDNDNVKIPPLHQPKKAPKPSQRKLNRILFLTDSVNSNFNNNLFTNDDFCFKKTCYELADIGKFEREFQYTDIVFISCGVNDLSRYDHTADSLIAQMSSKIETWCSKYPNTIFIYNSMLSTRFDWLNREIHDFNQYMFEMSLGLPNFWFLDTHDTIVRNRMFPISNRGNGIHITPQAKSLLEVTIRNAISNFLTSDHSRKHEHPWLLRPYFKHLSNTSDFYEF